MLNDLIDAVYQVREGPDLGMVSIFAHHHETLKNLRKVCEAMTASSHKKKPGVGRGIPH